MPAAALLVVIAPQLTACGSSGPRPDALTPIRERFEAADKNGDEALSRDEMRDGMPEFLKDFDTIDTDGNGLVSAAEMRSFLLWQRVLRAQPTGPDPGR